MNDWESIYIIDCDIPGRAKNALISEFGDAVTLGDIKDMPLGHFRNMKGVGPAAVQHIVAAMTNALKGTRPKASVSLIEAAMEKVDTNE
jgi:hypothetical protein